MSLHSMDIHIRVHASSITASMKCVGDIGLPQAVPRGKGCACYDDVHLQVVRNPSVHGTA